MSSSSNIPVNFSDIVKNAIVLIRENLINVSHIKVSQNHYSLKPSAVLPDTKKSDTLIVQYNTQRETIRETNVLLIALLGLLQGTVFEIPSLGIPRGFLAINAVNSWKSSNLKRKALHCKTLHSVKYYSFYK